MGFRILLFLHFALSVEFARAEAPPKIDLVPIFKIAETLAAESVIRDAVIQQNKSRPKVLSMIDNKKWKMLPVSSPTVSGLAKNTTAEFIRSKVPPYIGEAFVSDASGYKVGFLSKTTSIIHAGAPKHDVPMTGKQWSGAIEYDESTGQHQIQISVPILNDQKPIGSLVLGISVAKYLRTNENSK